MSNGFEKEKNIFQELKNEVGVNTINFILLSVITSGIYNLLWLYRSHKVISKKLKLEFIDDKIIILITFLYTVQLAIPKGCHRKEIFMMKSISILLSLTILILGVIIAFKAKTILEISIEQNYNINLKMNGVLTFLLGLIYINYQINNLPKIVSENKKDVKKEENEDLDKQKATIMKYYKKGFAIKELSEDFNMSEEEIEKIIKFNMMNEEN